MLLETAVTVDFSIVKDICAKASLELASPNVRAFAVLIPVDVAFSYALELANGLLLGQNQHRVICIRKLLRTQFSRSSLIPKGSDCANLFPDG